MFLEAFLILRIFYAVVMIGIVVGVVIWAVRHGQFKDQEYIAGLPLDIDD